ncbi:MAG: hypothetical protein OXI25_08550 [Chloroflexota bacterium]|nr:hypothetical protein [Chloroflexota bacterium]
MGVLVKVESKAGLVRGAASQAIEVGGAERTLIIGAVSQPGRTVASQLGHVYRHIDGVLEQHGMQRNNVVSWECVCDPQVDDHAFYDVVMPAMARYFRDCEVKPVAANVSFARLLEGRLIQVSMLAMA